eukprot:11785331-Karenia_brevis.AAC.1
MASTPRTSVIGRSNRSNWSTSMITNDDMSYAKWQSSWTTQTFDEWRNQQPDATGILPIHGANKSLPHEEPIYEVRHQRTKLPHGQNPLL